MQTINFTSLRGTELTGKVSAEKVAKRQLIRFVYKLNRIYAVVNGQSIDETPDVDDFRAFTERVVGQL